MLAVKSQPFSSHIFHPPPPPWAATQAVQLLLTTTNPQRQKREEGRSAHARKRGRQARPLVAGVACFSMPLLELPPFADYSPACGAWLGLVLSRPTAERRTDGRTDGQTYYCTLRCVKKKERRTHTSPVFPPHTCLLFWRKGMFLLPSLLACR